MRDSPPLHSSESLCLQHIGNLSQRRCFLCLSDVSDYVSPITPSINFKTRNVSQDRMRLAAFWMTSMDLPTATLLESSVAALAGRGKRYWLGHATSPYQCGVRPRSDDSFVLRIGDLLRCEVCCAHRLCCGHSSASISATSPGSIDVAAEKYFLRRAYEVTGGRSNREALEFTL